MIADSQAVAYAKWAATPKNRKVPRYVKKQAREWLKIVDGKVKGARVDEDAYALMCMLLHLMIHPDLGCPMDEGLERYAWFLLTATFCTLDDDGNLYYQTVLLEIARKNYKTFTAAIIFILFLLTGPNFSRFFSVAPDLKLSSELKLALRKIIKSSPALLEDDALRIMRSEIRCTLTDSSYEPLAYSEDRMDGRLANVFLADEAGAMDSYPIQAMRSSQITLRSKLGIIISTQYPNDDNGMIDEIDIAKKQLDGLAAMKAQRRFSLLYEPDEELLSNDQWMKNDLVIYQSNPVAVDDKAIFDAIKDMRAMAVLYKNQRQNYLCKHNNIKYRGLGVEGYIEQGAVKRCMEVIDPSFWRGKRVFLGLDLSMSDDNTSVAMATTVDDWLYLKIWCFIPRDRMEYKSSHEGVDYEKMVEQGYCIACGDDVIDYGTIEAHILGLKDALGVDIVQCGYDPWNALSTVQKLESGGIECVDIKQHSSVLHGATKLWRELILQKRCKMDDNPLLLVNFQNARCTEDTNKNKYVNKKKSSGKVDMVVSGINSVYLVEQNMLFGTDDFVVQT